MRRYALFIASVIFGSALVGSVPRAEAGVSVGVSFFYDDLAPHGDWFDMEDYGWVWTPRRVASDWRPYSRGHWVFSDDDGWLWLSDDDDWGWATSHYGRWFFDDRYGWVWVPGREWAPAWVSWRHGGGYVGWAPLPPEYVWRPGGGSGGGFDFDRRIHPRQYVFVPDRHFLDRDVYRRALPPTRNSVFVNVTRNVTNYGVVGDRAVNRGLSVEQWERALGRRVPRVRVEEERARVSARQRVQRDVVKVFRPAAREIEQADRERPRAQAVARVKPRPAEPPANPRAIRRERPPRAAAVAVNESPKPTRESAAQANAERRAERESERQRRQAETRAREDVRERQQAEQGASREREAVERRQARESQQRQEESRRQELRQAERQEQATQQAQRRAEREQRALQERQAREQQELARKKRQAERREADERRSQQRAQQQRQQEEHRAGLQQRQQEEQRARLQQRQQRDQQARQEQQRREQERLQARERQQQHGQPQDGQPQKKGKQEGRKRAQEKPRPTPPPQ